MRKSRGLMCLCSGHRDVPAVVDRSFSRCEQDVFTDHLIRVHPQQAERPSGEEAADSQDLSHSGVLTRLHLKASGFDGMISSPPKRRRIALQHL